MREAKEFFIWILTIVLVLTVLIGISALGWYVLSWLFPEFHPLGRLAMLAVFVFAGFVVSSYRKLDKKNA